MRIFPNLGDHRMDVVVQLADRLRSLEHNWFASAGSRGCSAFRDQHRQRRGACSMKSDNSSRCCEGPLHLLTLVMSVKVPIRSRILPSFSLTGTARTKTSVLSAGHAAGTLVHSGPFFKESRPASMTLPRSSGWTAWPISRALLPAFVR